MHTSRTFSIIFAMNLIQMPLGLVAALPNWVWPELEDLPWICVIGTAGLTAHFCMTRAFMLADATLVLPIDYLRLPLAAVIGFLLYNEAVEMALSLVTFRRELGNGIRALRRLKLSRKMRSSSRSSSSSNASTTG